MEAGDIALGGVVYRIDDDQYETEGYDEADEFEAELEGELAAIAALENSVVEVGGARVWFGLSGGCRG